MNNFSMCTFGVNTRYYLLATGTYLSFVSQYMIQNVFSRIDVASSLLGLTKISELWGFFVGVACAATISTPLIVWSIDRLGLKYVLLLGMAVTGTGLFLQSLVDITPYLALSGYMLVNLGSIAPWVSIVFLTCDWFLEAQWITVLCCWQLGRVGGHCLAYYCTYLYVGVDNKNLDSDELLDKYKQLLKIYLAITFTSLLLMIIGIKSKPQGLEITKRKNPRGHLLRASYMDVRDTENHSRIDEPRKSVKEPILTPDKDAMAKFSSLANSPVPSLSARGTLITNGGHTVLIQNNDNSTMQANRSSVAPSIDIRILSTWTRIKILMFDGYFKYLVAGSMLPLALTGFGEMFISANMLIFDIKQVESQTDTGRFATRHYDVLNLCRSYRTGLLLVPGSPLDETDDSCNSL